MSKFQYTVILATLTFSMNLFAQMGYLPGKYEVDPLHSRVSFVVAHFVVSEVEGRFNDVKGVINLGENITNSQISATVPVNSIDTAVKKRDEDLRSKNFFDAKKYPEMKLVSKSFEGTPESFRMIAALTIKDVTKDVIFDGQYTGTVKDTWGNQRVALQATAKINRKDFNINYNEQIDIGPAVGEEVVIRLWSEGIKIDESKKIQAKKE